MHPPANPALERDGRQSMQFKIQNSKLRIKNFSVGDSKNAADEFWEIGHSADGGLRNGDLLTLKSANATILPTASCDPENLSPRGFGSTFSAAKGGRKKF